MPNAKVWFFLACAALPFADGAWAQSPDAIPPGAYLLIRALAEEGPVVPNALVNPSPVSVEHLTVSKDLTGRLLAKSDEAPELGAEIHQVENFVSFTLVRREPRQKILQSFTYLCEAHPRPDGTFGGAFTALGRTGGLAEGLGGAFKREGSFVLYPIRTK